MNTIGVDLSDFENKDIIHIKTITQSMDTSSSNILILEVLPICSSDLQVKYIELNHQTACIVSFMCNMILTVSLNDKVQTLYSNVFVSDSFFHKSLDTSLNIKIIDINTNSSISKLDIIITFAYIHNSNNHSGNEFNKISSTKSSSVVNTKLTHIDITKEFL